MLPAKAIDWGGNERFEVVSCLGRGGMGVVYEVFDRERGEVVAAKKVLQFDPVALYLFKQEFRTLADVRHPNLVRFYELVQRAESELFFTMERVKGSDFVRYVRTSPGDCGRLRAALRQLAEGVCALHDAGKLHRDIKPSNVLVTDEGRVVLLDFGVSTVLARRTGFVPTPSGEFVGSALYAAPEQGDAAQPIPASDWYSVGVILYEALVGRTPFDGSFADVLSMKSNRDAEAPSKSVPGVPPDLDALCMALLDRDPARRPSGAEILGRLGQSRSAPPVRNAGSEHVFVGRAAQFDALWTAFEASRKDGIAAIRVDGEPGMGKSALVQRFLERAEREGGATVVVGRTYQQEAVPYKAVDGMVDALSDALVALDEQGNPLPLPEGAAALANLFPVLRRVPGIGGEPAASTDPQDLRRRAFGALRSILAGLAARGPLVVFLDDVQWGDLDSAALLLDVLRPPGAPRLLLVMTERESEARESTFCRALVERWSADVPIRSVTIGPLDPGDAEGLARALLDPSDPSAGRIARAVARESRGSPFLIEELARSNRALHASGETLGVVSLEQMVAERVAKLPAGAQRVIQTLAVVGHPTPVSLVGAACEEASVDETVALLVARRFARVVRRDRFEAVETIHDRIRETIVALLEPDVLRATHASLLRVLADAPGIDPEEVALHARGAGDEALAAKFTERAAEQASRALAFDRAARLYRSALELLPRGAPDILRCRVALGEALMYGGRSEDSAQAYLAAAEEAPRERRSALRREAAHQLLTGGHIAKANDVLHEVLASVGMRAPRTTLAAVFWLLVYRIWLAIVGLRIRELPIEEVPAERRLRIDALYTVVGGFSMVDPIVGACMQARHLIEALRGADGFRLLRAVVVETAHTASSGRPETPRERALHEAERALLARLRSDDAERYAGHIRGITCFQRGRWVEARERLRRQLDTLPYGLPGMAIVRIYSIFVDHHLGEIGLSVRRARALYEQAVDRGDLYTSVNLRSTSLANGFLVEDDPAAARATIHAALADWPQTSFSVQHWQAMIYEAYIGLYEGRSAEAYASFVGRWRTLERSLLLQGAAVRIPALYTRVSLAVASLRDATHPLDARIVAARVREATRFVARLDKETDPWAGVMAAMARAALENAIADRAAAVASLRLAMDRAEATDTRFSLMVARYRLGELLGGQEGSELLADVRGALAEQGIRNPARFIGMHLPGVWA